MITMESILIEIQNLRDEIQRSNFYKKPHYSTKEAAHFLGVSVSYMQKLIAAKKITHYRPSGRKLILIKRSDLNDFIMKNKIYSNDDIDSIVADNLINFKY